MLQSVLSTRLLGLSATLQEKSVPLLYYSKAVSLTLRADSKRYCLFFFLFFAHAVFPFFRLYICTILPVRGLYDLVSLANDAAGRYPATALFKSLWGALLILLIFSRAYLSDNQSTSWRLFVIVKITHFSTQRKSYCPALNGQ